MRRDRLYRLKRLPIVAGVALGFGLVYCLLLCNFHDAIETADELQGVLGTSQGDGPPVLLGLTSMILGWVAYVVMADWLGAVGAVVWLTSLLLCLCAMMFGFGIALVFRERVPGSIWGLAALSVVTAGATSVLRAYWHKSA